MKTVIHEKDPVRIDDVFNLCKRTLNNFRQCEALDIILSNMHINPINLPISSSKVIINVHSILYLNELSDADLSVEMHGDINDSYRSVLRSMDFNGQEIDAVLNKRDITSQTTVEVNKFINIVIGDVLKRVNELPDSQALRAMLIERGKIKSKNELFTLTDLRERAILTFAQLSAEKKINVIHKNIMKYGIFLSR